MRAAGHSAASTISLSPAAIRTGKAGFYEQAALPLERAYALAGARMVENMLDPDTDEGICAFLDKRPPAWAPRS